VSSAEAPARSPVAPRWPFRPLPEWAGPATRLVHADRRPDRNAGAIAPPIYQSSTFHFPAEHSPSARDGGVYLYTRHENPTQEAAAEIVRDLEGAAAARAFASGMGAISTTLLALLGPGEEMVAMESLYGGTVALLTDLLPRFDIRVRWLSDAEAADPERCLGPTTALALLETPTNPTLRVVDLARWGEACDRAHVLSVVDNTFATPILQRPLSLGIDLVVHSATKYLGGHADLVAGVVAGPAPLLERIRSAQLLLGSVLDPFAAFLLVRGMRTLELRVERASRTAGALVAELAAHPKVERVAYPGRGSAEEDAIAARQMRARGGMIAITVRGGLPAARRFLGSLHLFQVASSLGGVESLASLPRETSHAALGSAERARRGIDDGMVRLSVGLEEPEDLARDLREALEAI
jgi:cystathionine beta-lyase/cystathionine gamma-synthase